MSKSEPPKPYRDFPLTAHPNGQCCKKIRGKVHFFGVWEEPDLALHKYLDVKDDLQAGRQPRRLSDGVNLADVCNQYLARAEARRDAGEISHRTFDDYHDACKLMVTHLGRIVDPEQLRPADFAGFRSAMVKKYAPSRMTKIIGITRMVFRWSHDGKLIDRLPRFGPDFKGASKRVVRQQKAATGEKMFSRLPNCER